MENNDKYQRGKIYRLVCNTTGSQYYGSSCEKYLSNRLAQHKSNYKHFLNGGKRSFVTSFDIIKNNNYEIFLVELFPCNNIDELHQRERYYIENNECVNKIIPGRTPKEYWKVNRNELLERKKEYYQENKDEIIKKQKKYSELNKENIKEFYKKWQKENREKIKEYGKKYREKLKLKKSAIILNETENKSGF